MAWAGPYLGGARFALANFRRRRQPGCDTPRHRGPGPGWPVLRRECRRLTSRGRHAAALVATGWVFTTTTVTYDDVTVMLASSHYCAGASSSIAWRPCNLVDPAFTADVGTVEGRAVLAARIEELLNG